MARIAGYFKQTYIKGGQAPRCRQSARSLPFPHPFSYTARPGIHLHPHLQVERAAAARGQIHSLDAHTI